MSKHKDMCKIQMRSNVYFNEKRTINQDQKNLNVYPH